MALSSLGLLSLRVGVTLGKGRQLSVLSLKTVGTLDVYYRMVMVATNISYTSKILAAITMLKARILTTKGVSH